MSHFTVGVFIDNIDDMHCLESCLDGVLAPYQEDASEEYLEFHNLYEENRERYKQESIEMVQLPDGSTIFPWDDDELKKKIPFIVLFDDGDKEKYQEPRWYTRRCLVNNKSCTMCFDLFTANAELKEIPFSVLYPKYEDFLTDYIGAEFDDEMQEYGYWENPNSKWDWWVIGGRWENSLKLKSGEKANYARIKDIDFTPAPDTVEYYHKLWRSLISGVCETGIEKWQCIGYPNAETLIETYGSEEEFVRIQSSFSTFAVITKDGEWIEKGEMGWWGISSDTPEESYVWDRDYIKHFIDGTDPNTVLVIVDCHI